MFVPFRSTKNFEYLSSLSFSSITISNLFPLELMACTSPNRTRSSHDRYCQRIFLVFGALLAKHAYCLVSSS